MKNSVKQLFSLFLAMAMLFVVASCDDDDPTPTPDPDPDPVDTFTVTSIDETREIGGQEVEFKQTQISGIINRDYTFTNDVVWVLNGRVIVAAGSTLTIEPGTIIKGLGEQGALASVLVVARDAEIQANGTAADPIVFTSFLDNINVGEFASTLSVDGDANNTAELGLWGGVLILGNAPIFADAAEVQIEGIPSSVTEGLYGGTDAADNSGSFRYVSIRFTGQQLGPGNELQGLTLGGVGSGTTISHVESINSADDGIEIFGGTVNISNFIVVNPDDDGFDTDQGWSGTATNVVYIGGTGSTNNGIESDHGFELDGPEGDTGGTAQIGKFRNASVWGRSASDFADLRDGATYDIQDSYFFGFKAGVDLELDADGSDDGSGGSLSDNATISDNYAGGTVILVGNEFNENDNSGATSFTDITSILNDKLDTSIASVAAKAAQVDNNENVKFPGDNTIVSSRSTGKGADVSVLSWSYTADLGLLANGF